MPRGEKAPLGTETVNANGYTQVKTENGWKAKHTIILEQKLGRKLMPGERAVFKDGDRSNLKPENIELTQGHKKESVKARIARWEKEIADRQEWIAEARKTLELE